MRKQASPRLLRKRPRLEPFIFRALKSTPTSFARATFLLLILASIITFKCGWFVRSAGAVEVPVKDFRDFYKASELKAKALSKQVTSAPWFAGEYYTEMEGEGMGDTHNSMHYITANLFFLENVCCMDCGPQCFGVVRDLGEGRLELCPRYARMHGPTQCWTVSIIRWGDRQYLVYDSGRRFFEQEIATGKEPRSTAAGGYPMRYGDWHKEAKGKPIFPEID